MAPLLVEHLDEIRAALAEPPSNSRMGEFGALGSEAVVAALLIARQVSRRIRAQIAFLKRNIEDAGLSPRCLVHSEISNGGADFPRSIRYDQRFV